MAAQISPNQLCVITVADAPFTEDCTPPTVALQYATFVQQLPPTYLYEYIESTAVPQDYGTFDLGFLGTNFDTWSIDVVSGPWTGNLASGNGFDDGLTTWAGNASGTTWPASDLNALGTYVVRFSVEGCGGTAYIDQSFTVVEGPGTPIEPPAEPEYSISLNSQAWVTDINPDGVAYTHASNVLHFTLDVGGVMSVDADETPLTPSPEQYQWLFEVADPGNKPISGAVTELYEVKFSIYPPPADQSYGLPWPWNWWHSKGRLTVASKLEVVGAVVEQNRDAGGDEMDEWLSMTAQREWFVYLPIDTPGQIGYGWMQPVVITVQIRKIADHSDSDVSMFILAIGNDPS